MLWPLKTFPHVLVTHNHKVILLLLRNCCVSTVMNPNVRIWYADCLIWDPQGDMTHLLRTASLKSSLIRKAWFLYSWRPPPEEEAKPVQPWSHLKGSYPEQQALTKGSCICQSEESKWGHRIMNTEKVCCPQTPARPFQQGKLTYLTWFAKKMVIGEIADYSWNSAFLKIWWFLLRLI